jgi:hypothetical protein
MRTPVGIVGFRGYSGAELITLLNRHPHAEPVLLEHREQEDRPRPIGRSGPRTLAYSPEAVRAAGLAAVFLATPPEVSMDLAGPLLEAGAKVIDLSGAFRLGTTENYQRWYKEPHTQAANCWPRPLYGLPEFCRARVPGARLVANPGCYPTAANLAIRPLVDAGSCRCARRASSAMRQVRRERRGPQALAQDQLLRGRGATFRLTRSSITGTWPEVLMTSGLAEGEFSFTAQLAAGGPRDPGDRLFPGVRPQSAIGRRSAEPSTQAALRRASPSCGCIRRGPGAGPARGGHTRTFCDIGAAVGCRHGPRRGRFSAIDNLGKGRGRAGGAEHEPGC